MAQVSYEKMMAYYESKVGGLTNDVFKRDVAIDALEEELETVKAENERIREALVSMERGDTLVRSECDSLTEENRRLRAAFAPATVQDAMTPDRDGDGYSD